MIIVIVFTNITSAPTQTSWHILYVLYFCLCVWVYVAVVYINVLLFFLFYFFFVARMRVKSTDMHLHFKLYDVPLVLRNLNSCKEDETFFTRQSLPVCMLFSQCHIPSNRQFTVLLQSLNYPFWFTFPRGARDHLIQFYFTLPVHLTKLILFWIYWRWYHQTEITTGLRSTKASNWNVHCKYIRTVSFIKCDIHKSFWSFPAKNISLESIFLSLCTFIKLALYNV